MAVEIDEYLEIKQENNYKLEILQKYSNLHKNYKLNEIISFYNSFYRHEIDFNFQVLTVTEILYACTDFMSFIDDELFTRIVINWFIIKNNLISDFDNFLQPNLENFLKLLDINYSHNYSYLIDKSDRIIKLINIGKIYPFMTNCDSTDLKLIPTTFRYLIKRNPDISALMAYQELSDQEIQIIIEKIVNDKSFSNNCKKFIEDQGILNDNMLIISSLCSAKPLIRNNSTSKIHKYFCGKHFKSIYLPFESFSSILDLSKYEVYYLYLQNKVKLDQDLEDIIDAIKSFNNERNNNINEISMGASILDLVLNSGLIPEYDKDIYIYLTELQDMQYFNKICKKFARELIEDNIFKALPACLLSISTVFSYLKRAMNYKINDKKLKNKNYHNDNTSFNTIICSFETLNTFILESSLDDQSNKLPIISFDEFGVLEEDEKLIILESYIKYYDINDIIRNFLSYKGELKTISFYFESNINKIVNKTARIITHCKLNLPLETKELSDSDIIAVINSDENPYLIRECFYLRKLKKSDITKFISKLDNKQIDEIIRELETISTTVEFAILFINFLENKYELKHIFKMLLKFLTLKNINIVKRIQKLIINILEELFIEEIYLDLISQLYSKMLGFNDLDIKMNNDKILVLLGKIANIMKKELYVGNLKPIQQ